MTLNIDKILNYLNISPFKIKNKVAIAILDSGINDRPSITFSNKQSQFDLKNMHGSYIFKILKILVPDAVIVSLKVIDDDGKYNLDYLTKAINYCQNNDIKIINYSNSLPVYNQQLLRAIKNYSGLIITSSGNESLNLDYNQRYPSSFGFDNVLSVGSSNVDDQISSFSNYGLNSVDLLAPGEGVIVNSDISCTKVISGTSISCAIVTSFICKLVDCQLSPIEAKKHLITNVKKIEILKEKVKSCGIISSLSSNPFLIEK